MIAARRIWILATLSVMLLVVAFAANWERLSEALERSSEATSIALFRAGELPSIAARLEERYGEKPKMRYEVDATARTLTLVFASDPLRDESGDAAAHATQVAAVALSLTDKADDVDEVAIEFIDVAPGVPFRRPGAGSDP